MIIVPRLPPRALLLVLSATMSCSSTPCMLDATNVSVMSSILIFAAAVWDPVANRDNFFRPRAAVPMPVHRVVPPCLRCCAASFPSIFTISVGAVNVQGSRIGFQLKMAMRPDPQFPVEVRGRGFTR
jgi:hypothetical protein